MLDVVFCSSNPKEAVESPLKVSKSTFVRVHYSLIISLIFQDFFFYLAHLRLIVKLTSAVSKLKKQNKKKKQEKTVLCVLWSGTQWVFLGSGAMQSGLRNGWAWMPIHKVLRDFWEVEHHAKSIPSSRLNWFSVDIFRTKWK